MAGANEVGSVDAALTSGDGAAAAGGDDVTTGGGGDVTTRGGCGWVYTAPSGGSPCARHRSSLSKWSCPSCGSWRRPRRGGAALLRW